ncbi:YHS domain-containing (seleno)protein [Polymorphum gilvum]|uniref:YHS domain protein n=1 Tax=Polymorphum gilvum (strain LMG 25793 / CGMCC 1.9160 / SL003B-26A1) TaxID=991905 RepID=F2J4A1_POLGS|nr:YHS domain-containing (seleno)protein [Polymorphum gilvum]ADZ71043.1 YHS domain protein [Polymorphum gilvum SL003B-26A1]
MSTLVRRILPGSVALALTLAGLPALADDITTYVKDGAALGGTDPVAYFTQGKPVQGSEAHTFTYDDVTWTFATAENRDAFAADPQKYAPQYGGWCATGASFGVKIPIDPAKWQIVDGKLYLNAHDGAQQRFKSDTANVIRSADENWPKIRETPADKL